MAARTAHPFRLRAAALLRAAAAALLLAFGAGEARGQAAAGAKRKPEKLVVRDDWKSPRNKERPARKATTLIVLHTTEAHAKSALAKLSERGEAHYCVTEKGEVYRIVERHREAFHAGRSMWRGKEDCDSFSIGIEVVGHHNRTMPLRQLEALRKLVKALQRIYAVTDDRVVSHSHVAYGAPNTWHKKKHRGRKRCGMLFAMPSVRAKLGLAARPAADADVAAKRLVQADEYLSGVLYGKTDTMRAYYGAPKKKTGKGAARAAYAAKKGAAPKKKEAAPKKAEAAKKSALAAKGAPAAKAKAAAAAAPEAKREAAPAAAPAGVKLGKAGACAENVAALLKLPGYVKGGPVSAARTPYRIAGAAWRAADTYYCTPAGHVERGSEVDEKSIAPGTYVFYRAKAGRTGK